MEKAITNVPFGAKVRKGIKALAKKLRLGDWWDDYDKLEIYCEDAYGGQHTLCSGFPVSDKIELVDMFYIRYEHFWCYDAIHEKKWMDENAWWVESCNWYSLPGPSSMYELELHINKKNIKITGYKAFK